ncbi:MAG: hypothetical protein IJA95_06940 [Bacteroidaceae bacterium]|nr:hypothetical protein [Bacteroidaceae bacterium]
MKFIQIISQGKAPGTGEIFTHTKTINVSQILEITSGMGRDFNYIRITMVNGEEIPIGMKEYNALLALIQDEWEGIRVLPCVQL